MCGHSKNLKIEFIITSSTSYLLPVKYVIYTNVAEVTSGLLISITTNANINLVLWLYNDMHQITFTVSSTITMHW